MPRLVSADHATPHLVQLDGLEQGPKVAFTKPLVALALNDFEEDRADHGAGEDLQQQSLALGRGPIDQDTVPAQSFQVLSMARHPFVNPLVIGVRGLLQRHTVFMQ